ncbi:tail assembly protein [Escherichia coli]|nr:tail assembly protein [Escherichia coli]
MVFRMSEQPRTITIYNLLAGTNEFIGEGDAYIPPHTGLPANSTDIAPPDIPAGFVAVFNSDEASWHLVEDHRGKTVYDVASGDALFISELGPLPENGKRAARTVLTGMCYSVGSATRQGSSSPTRFIGQSAMTSRT